MTKQQKTYILLVLVIGIWGLIGYNVYKNLNPEEPKSITNFTKTKTFNLDTKLKDTIVISNYRDPFLGNIINSKKNLKTSTKPQQPVNFPLIIYNGIINGNRNTSYIISVQNQQEVVKIGQTFMDVKLLSANSKEITIEYKKARKTIQLIQ